MLDISVHTTDDNTEATVADSAKVNNLYQTTWEKRSSIRTRPKKSIDFSKEGYFFPESKQPLLLNPAIVALGESTKQEILLQSFRKYLHDIINIEIKDINFVCNQIIYGDLPVKYTEADKTCAYLVIIDEYYHVYLARDMLQQLQQQFPTLPTLTYPPSDAHHAIQTLRAQLDSKYHTLFHIIAVCIFETTLVRELIEFFNTPSIHPSIQYYVNDHMNDESRHFGYFERLLAYTWQHLPSDYQDEIGVRLAEFVQLYLNVASDKQYFCQLAATYLNNGDQASQIVDKLYQGFEVTPELPIIKNVLKILARVGVLAHPAVRQGFTTLGWDLAAAN